jgi:membrane-associated PAP2 superfamily phosphatase
MRVPFLRQSSITGNSPAAFYLSHAGAALIMAFALFGIFEYTNLDLRISDLYYDPTMHQFPLRHDWFLEVVMHHWAKYMIVLIAVGAATGFLASFRVGAFRPHRRMLLFIFLSLAMGPLVVSILKHVSAKYCPWDLQMYGGFAPYLRLFQFAPSDLRPGQCFPSGHASGGFALMAFYFVWRGTRPTLARAMLVGGFTCGIVLGFGRMLQGAHFLSHNLWAAVVVWVTMLLLHRAILYRMEFTPIPEQRLPTVGPLAK